MKDFITLEEISFSYGKQTVIKNASLSLNKGSSYALIGKSGTGKSTLLNLIAGFIKPDSGRIQINGELIHGTRRDTAFLFQELGLFPWQTVKEGIQMPLKLRGIKDKDYHKVTSLLKDMGLESHVNKYPSELSGGEKQRVALARTLIGEPDLLLMDEPTSALDAMTKEELHFLIHRELMKRKVTLLFVTHDIEEAMTLAQTILIMKGDKSITSVNNPYYLVEHAKDNIGFYNECIKIRKLLNLEKV